MTNLTRPTEPRVVSPRRLAASALALTAAVAAAAGAMAGEGTAAPSPDAGRASYARAGKAFKAPKLKHGELSVRGTRGDDTIALRLQAGEPGVLQVDVGDDGSADFSFGRAEITSLAVEARAGNDRVRIDDANGTFTDGTPTTIDGGPGNDTLAGGAGAETLNGGSGSDSLDGNRGADVAFMGAGDDTFVWDPGDGSDTIEGQDGADTMRFVGANIAEHVDLSANGDRLRFFRDAGSITMDTDGVERVDFEALGGADVITVDDLTRTDVRHVGVDQSTPAGSGNGDGQSDQVIVNGTEAADRIVVDDEAGGVNVAGRGVSVAVRHPEPGDRLVVNGLAGDDTIDASGLAAGALTLTLDGGAGDDVLIGSAGDDVLLGRDGDDVLAGGPGQDVLDGGPGDNLVVQD